MKSIGTLRYSPELLGRDKQYQKYWLVLDCDSSLVNYYRELYRLSHWKTREIIRPAWDSHITVIRNEEPPCKEHWEKYNGVKVEFAYEPSPKTDENYWWLPVKCQQLIFIRMELGLDRDPIYPLHLSIGHQGLVDHSDR